MSDTLVQAFIALFTLAISSVFGYFSIKNKQLEKELKAAIARIITLERTNAKLKAALYYCMEDKRDRRTESDPDSGFRRRFTDQHPIAALNLELTEEEKAMLDQDDDLEPMP